MPKAVRGSTKPTVSDLLAKKRERPKILTPEQREQVAAALAHNDATPNPKRRISSRALCELLREHYGWTLGETALERAIRLDFGRKTWAKS